MNQGQLPVEHAFEQAKSRLLLEAGSGGYHELPFATSQAAAIEAEKFVLLVHPKARPLHLWIGQLPVGRVQDATPIPRFYDLPARAPVFVGRQIDMYRL